MDAWWYLPVACRILPLALLVPAAGGQRVPLPARLAVVAVLAWSLAQLLELPGLAPAGIDFLLLLARELAAGMVLALAASSLFAVLEMTGQLIDSGAGAARLQRAGIISPQRQGALAQAYLLVGILLFFALDGPGVFLEQLLHSYRLLPLAGARPALAGPVLFPELLALVAGAYQLACRLALPVLAALLLADCLLGVINRSAPQLPVFFVGMPLKAVLGLVAAALSLPEAAARFSEMLLP